MISAMLKTVFYNDENLAPVHLLKTSSDKVNGARICEITCPVWHNTMQQDKGVCIKK